MPPTLVVATNELTLVFSSVHCFVHGVSAGAKSLPLRYYYWYSTDLDHHHIENAYAVCGANVLRFIV